MSWLNLDAWNLALFLALISAAMFGGIRSARRGRIDFLRPIQGIAAMEEAVGRATELGQPVFYVPGVRDLDDVQTVASMSILESVAGMTARHQCDLFIPTNRSLVMNTAQETCRESYEAAGHGVAYRDEMVCYITDEQFAFAAEVDGLIAREKPAVCFLLGSFYAESLLLAESGNQSGAYQIAGTAGWHQLPFLVASCDHVLIGEELFAASAYLTRDPWQLGTLRGQDVSKFLVMGILVAGASASILITLTGWSWMSAVLVAILRLVEVR